MAWLTETLALGGWAGPKSSLEMSFILGAQNLDGLADRNACAGLGSGAEEQSRDDFHVFVSVP